MSSPSFLGMKNKELHRLVLQQQKSPQESTPPCLSSVLPEKGHRSGYSTEQNLIIKINFFWPYKSLSPEKESKL